MSPALQLPSLRILAKQTNVEVTATPSLNIDLPNNTQSITSIDDLLSLVQDSHLWITRSGACCIQISIAVNGRPILESTRLESIAKAVSSCEVWDRLGIHLKYDRSCTVGLPGLLYFSLQHPDLSSVLVAPSSAWTTPFRTLLVAIDVCKLVKRQEPPGESTRTSKRRKNTSKPAGKVEPRSESDLLETLEPVDQQAIENFISSLNFPLNEGLGNSPQAPVRSESATCTEVLEILRSSSLIDILFEQFILGPEKTYRGYHVWGCEPKYRLVNLAPGVFHMPYLKSVSDRAQLLPIIATSIARMQYAESPALRQKVADLRLCNKASADVHNQEVDCGDSIEKSA
ncbi:uncharacterized protein FTOL_04768 [Fusarium torulosum]|uniref:Uncharacterized protein n=1 Tax=Fusarium torulosum TaxID=33205 RepID=A0AAE8M6D4_9HYPO|nr:uncharacterized protein FTOL_04768 [Fusarium torulosum]